MATRSPGLTLRTLLPTLDQQILQSHDVRKGWTIHPPLDTTPDDSWPRTLDMISEGASRRDRRVYHWRLYYIVAYATVHKIMHLMQDAP
jgi:hypothetical protein